MILANKLGFFFLFLKFCLFIIELALPALLMFDGWLLKVTQSAWPSNFQFKKIGVPYLTNQASLAQVQIQRHPVQSVVLHEYQKRSWLVCHKLQRLF